MGRKKDLELLKLENKVDDIQLNIVDCINSQANIIRVYNNHMMQMRDLLNKLIEGA